MQSSQGKKRGRNATRLAETNPFEWDDTVSFSEEGHVYTVNGKKAELSVTSLVKIAFPSSRNFDGREICEANLSRWRNNASNRYYDVVAGIKDDDEAIAAVLAMWERNRDLGTLTHRAVELSLNDDELLTHDVQAADVKTELQQYLLFHKQQTLAGWKALRTELALYHTRADGTNVGGQVDVLYQDDTGKLRVIDVKRSDKTLDSSAHNYGKWGTGPAAEIKDTDYHRYSLQCWLYTIMLSELVGEKKTGAPMLVQVHPDLHAPSIIPCEYLEGVARQLLHHGRSS